MSDDERDRLEFELMKEGREAQKNAAACRERIRNLAEKLAVLSEWLTTLLRAYDGKSNEIAFHSRTLNRYVNVLTDASFRDAVNFDQMVEARIELLEALKRLDTLNERKRELNL